jgi:Haem-binding domain
MYVKIILIVLVVALVVIQFIPVQKTNPPVTGEIVAPENVTKVFKTSCYDCHSNEVVWPWYSRVAPASWLVAYDVNEAREEYNFSEWSSYNAEERMDNREEIWEEVEEGHMPLWYYVLLHPEAKLSVEDKEIIKKWSEGRL